MSGKYDQNKCNAFIFEKYCDKYPSSVENWYVSSLLGLENRIIIYFFYKKYCSMLFISTSKLTRLQREKERDLLKYQSW